MEDTYKLLFLIIRNLYFVFHLHLIQQGEPEQLRYVPVVLLDLYFSV